LYFIFFMMDEYFSVTFFEVRRALMSCTDKYNKKRLSL